jgi:hypothetical protein
MADQNSVPPRNQYADIIATMTPDELQALLDGTLAGPRGALAQGDWAQAQQMSETQQPGGRNLGYTYVAANPLEHMAAAIKQGMGYSDMRDARAQQSAQLDKQGTGLAQYLAMFQRGGRPLPVASQDPGLDPFSDVRSEGH